jgi:hypothetical protein
MRREYEGRLMGRYSHSETNERGAGMCETVKKGMQKGEGANGNEEE